MSIFPGTKTFAAVCLATTALVIVPGVDGAQAQTQTVDVGPQTGTYSGLVRGFWFEAPRDFYITGLDVPTEASTANFNAVILRLPSPPPSFSSNTTTTYTVLADVRDQASAVAGLNIAVSAGDFIGVLGNRGDVNSYGTSPYNSTILGSPVTLTRFGSQNVLSSAADPFRLPVWTESGGSISRVFLTVSEFLMLLGPSPEEELADLSAAASTSGRLVILNAHGVARTRGQDSLTTRDAVLSYTRVPDPETGSFTVTQSTMDSAQMMGGI
jgi:hypothetical protein